MSSIIYLSSKKVLYKRAAFFWLALIGNFFIQSMSQSGEAVIILGYGFALIPLNLLSYASIYFYKKEYPWKFFISLSTISFASSYFLLSFPSISFTLKAMPLAIGTAAPLLFITLLSFTNKTAENTQLMKVNAAILFIQAIHCFNFAFFRMDPSAQLWGWPVSYALYQMLAAVIPAMSLDFYHRQEQSRLKGIIAEKTRSLHESNKSLKEALGDREFLFRTLVHDVSNPLSVIFGRSKLLVRKYAGDKSIETISKMADRIQSLIEQVRLYEKGNDKDQIMNLKPLVLSGVLNPIAQMFEERLSKKEIKLNLHNMADFDNIYVFSEPKALSNSIIPNVINNAIKFCHKNNGKIDIYAEMISKEQCRITIEDNGIGMPQEILEKIFDFDAKTSRTGTGGEAGTGYGLPILKKLIERNGGQIYIETQEETQSQQGFTKVHLVFEASYKKSESISTVATAA